MPGLKQTWTHCAVIAVSVLASGSAVFAQLPREVTDPLTKAAAVLNRVESELADLAEQEAKEKYTLDTLVAMAKDPENLSAVIRQASNALERVEKIEKALETIIKVDLPAVAQAIKDASDAAIATGTSDQVALRIKFLIRRTNRAMSKAQDEDETAKELAKAFAALISKVTVK